MCTREELKSLLHELLFHVDRLAFLSATSQFQNENNQKDALKYLSYCEQRNFSLRNEYELARFKTIFRFQKAYLRYLIFSSDPYTEIIVPLPETLSSLALFIINIINKYVPQHSTMYMTSRTIVDFLQVRYYIDS